jgi:hypothetical protein
MDLVMNKKRQELLFAASGIGAVVLFHLGFIVTVVGGAATLTPSSTPAQVADALAAPASTTFWMGAYLEMLAVGLFVVFAVWAAARLGGGLIGSAVAGFGVAYAVVTMTSLAVLDAVQLRAGKGIGAQLATALTNVNEGLYITSWFLASFFLLAAGALAIVDARRALGGAAIGVAALILVGTAVSAENLGENATLLWFIWIIWASICLARGSQASRAHLDQMPVTTPAEQLLV